MALSSHVREHLEHAVRIALHKDECVRTISEVARTHHRKFRYDKTDDKVGSAWCTYAKVEVAVGKMFKMDPALYGDSRKNRDLLIAIRNCVHRMRQEGGIEDFAKQNLGIFRSLDPPPQDRSVPVEPYKEQKPKTEENMTQAFNAILENGAKDTTYKFALAVALLDFCKTDKTAHSDGHYVISYEDLANRFITYYWNQVYCRIRQVSQKKKNVKRDANIVKVIEAEFKDDIPPDPKFVDSRIMEKIRRKVLSGVFGHAARSTSSVVPRFQNTGKRNVVENRLFYEYDDDKQEIYLNKTAFGFFKKNHYALKWATYASWVKHLEKVNTTPKLISKLSWNRKRMSLNKHLNNLRKTQDCCFYCGDLLEARHIDVDHFIPWSYIFSDDVWNLTLACKRCNLKKSNSLANKEFLKYLINRNKAQMSTIIGLEASLYQLDVGKGWEKEMRNHYSGCCRYGFTSVRMP